MSDLTPRGPSEIVLYQTKDGSSRIEVRLAEGTVWLSQAPMAELYQTTKQNISLHIRNVLSEGELEEESVVKDSLTTAADGKRYRTLSYSLPMIIAVGYRVRSHRGTQFRRWATARLEEYLVKGFTMDDERLKEGRSLGADYFDELLERIRDIRASEKRFYQKIRDLFKLAIDYDSGSQQTREFFQIVQNKLHWAITGQTAAEIIHERADASKPNMGLTSWKGTKVRKADITIAKNYLNHEEIDELNRIVVMYLDYAEDQAKRRRPLYMRDWREKLDAFLAFNEREILDDPGKVSMEVAQRLALEQYERFSNRRLSEETAQGDAEFDRMAKQIESKAKPRARKPKKGKKR